MNPTTMIPLAAVVVTVISAVVMPIWFKRQTAKALKSEREETAKKLKAMEEKEEIKERAKQDAAKAAGDTVSWEGMNRALRATAQEASAAHAEQMARLRKDFDEQTARMKRQTDHELDRANARIQELERRLAGTPPGEK